MQVIFVVYCKLDFLGFLVICDLAERVCLRGNFKRRVFFLFHERSRAELGELFGLGVIFGDFKSHSLARLTDAEET